MTPLASELARTTAELLRRLERRVRRLQARMDAIAARGHVVATPQWRQRRYLYLDHGREATGARKRSYVGSDPARIEKALQMVSRGRQYHALERRQAELEALHAQVAEALEHHNTELMRALDNPVDEQSYPR